MKILICHLEKYFIKEIMITNYDRVVSPLMHSMKQISETLLKYKKIFNDDEDGEIG